MKTSKISRILLSFGLIALCAAACGQPFPPTPTPDALATAAQQLAQTQMALSVTQTAVALVPTETSAPPTAEPTLPPTRS